jgi:hypothetical protein
MKNLSLMGWIELELSRDADRARTGSWRAGLVIPPSGGSSIKSINLEGGCGHHVQGRRQQF